VTTSVLYIGGLGRSGSTILDILLGEVEGVAAIGEVRHLWERGLRDDALCACGARFGSCEFWREVGARAFGGWSHVDPGETIALARAVDRHRSLPGLLAHRPRRHAAAMEYGRILGRLFSAVAATSGARLVVDSSKDPPHGFVLRTVDALDLHAVHLVRDSRGVAYSWTKVFARPDATGDDTMMTRMSPAQTAVMWVDANALMEVFARCAPTLRLRYEDFVTDPDGSLGRVLNGTGIDSAKRTPGRIHHAIAGNPLRFRADRGPLRVDEEWRRQLSPSSRRLVTAITAPMLWRYGYSLETGC
jgi:Sulfotransferase family